MTSRWPAIETIANHSERKDEWTVTALTELPCKHIVSAKRKHRDKATATAQAKAVIPDKVRRHPNHSKGK